MKQQFVLTYINGYGETGCIKFSAYNLLAAKTIAKNYCTQNMIKKARITTKSNKHYTV